MNEWRGYVNLQVSQGRQIFNKIKGGAHIVYITDSPTRIHKHYETSHVERDRDYNNLKNILTNFSMRSS